MPQKPFAPPYDVLTNLLTEARRSAELTQRDLATRLAIGQSAVSKVERGVQRLDLVELHRWLDAIKGPTFLEFEPDPVWWTPRSHDERYPRTAGSVACDEPGIGRRWVTRCLASARLSLTSIPARQRRSNSAGAMLPSDEWRLSVL
jgi:transcriptional regulator with XRE-family HTH domain